MIMLTLLVATPLALADGPAEPADSRGERALAAQRAALARSTTWRPATRGKSATTRP